VLFFVFIVFDSVITSGIRAGSNSAENDVWIHDEDRQVYREKQFQSVADQDASFAEATWSVGTVDKG